jgi:hypothetical protein
MIVRVVVMLMAGLSVGVSGRSCCAFGVDFGVYSTGLC